jgi:ABC-type multidrug transport system permease subunit
MPNNFHSTSQLMEHEFVQHTSLIYKIITIILIIYLFFSQMSTSLFFFMTKLWQNFIFYCATML